jgi:hypothetical protein
MPNGNGVASGGSFNYWDRSYNGSGSVTTDNAPLSGGLGDLTDGVIATQNWNLVENVAGTGPYVGWRNLDPTITFQFASTASFDSVVIDFDDSDGNGGVAAPLGVVINGTNFAISDPAGSAPFAATFQLGGLNTSQIVIQIKRRAQWVFASEVRFFGPTTTVVPEPGTIASACLGAVVLLTAHRHRRRRSA